MSSIIALVFSVAPIGGGDNVMVAIKPLTELRMESLVGGNGRRCSPQSGSNCSSGVNDSVACAVNDDTGACSGGGDWCGAAIVEGPFKNDKCVSTQSCGMTCTLTSEGWCVKKQDKTCQTTGAADDLDCACTVTGDVVTSGSRLRC